jgi:diaminohydroxyphosphoribosylaminopyrimidine deaminase/5-amino-6-(5-phosphoribosylamino)uracil reductase
MQLALELAEKYRGKTSPNPVVGAVVVKNGKIVGQGAHQYAGGPHAEVYALEAAGKKAAGSTLYVTLEPCCHYGKTPPCTDRIIASGVSKVVLATLDPNPLVSGKGVEQLRKAGIEVEIGMGNAEAREQNEVFFHFIRTKRPFVIAKAAISLDGKIAAKDGSAKWISNSEARIQVHKLRAQAEAILIGKNTLLTDNPSLNVRLQEESEGPQKIVIIPQLEIDVSKIRRMNIYQKSVSKPLIIVCHKSFLSARKLKEFTESGIEIIPLSGRPDQLDLYEFLTKLGEKQITSLLLEGGAGVFTSFLHLGLINKFHIFQAPLIIGEYGISFLKNLEFESMEDIIKMDDIKVEVLGNNIHWIWNVTTSDIENLR